MLEVEKLVEKTKGTLRSIGEKVLEGKRLSFEEGVKLFYEADLSYVASLAEYINRKKNGMFAYFVVNAQINPTNICIYQCNFCSFGVTKSDPKA
ncbi:MAG: aminofutalosine synthase MqnE, partial [Candidatus Omnitrophica bacterium]|nr:aminofutalosine synthase MqnE [Candidatus Omnitrophota bacterium]